jgi:hypothetical protein
MPIMDCFDAVIRVKAKESFWVFVCGGFGRLA